MLAGLPLDYRRCTKIDFSPRLPEPVPGLLRYALSWRKQTALDGIVFFAIIFPV